MIKIITALGNENLNLKLRKEKDIEILLTDIQYKEGIIEALEKEKNIQFLILSDLLPGEISLQELIKKIIYINIEIKIIVFIEQYEKEIENELYSLGVYKVLYDNELDINNFMKILLEPKNENEKLKEEINKLKNIILEKEYRNNKKYKNKEKINKKIKDNKIKNILKNRITKKLNNNKKLNNINFNSKIICVTGPCNVGKSIFTINLAKTYSFFHKKIAILDLDILQNDTSIILGLKNEEYSLTNLFIRKKNKINKNIDLFRYKLKNHNNVLTNNYKIFTENLFSNIKKEINNIKNIYDYIIVDTNFQNIFETKNNIIKLSYLNIFLSDTILL